jgi:chorismate mutase/prephenate dehydrogenase
MNYDAKQQLEQLRQAIDNTDAQLIELIKQRSELTKQVGDVKRHLQAPLYVPEREQQMISARRQQAEQMELSPDLIEDVLRRIIRESYRTQTAQATPTSCALERPVIIVGGRGRLGGLFCRLFKQTGYAVEVIDKGDALRDIAQYEPQLVIIAVPVNVTNQVISELPPLPNDCVLADLTSIKHQPLQHMLARHEGPVVGLHPMFGPSVPNLAKQLVVACEGRGAEAYQWLIAQLTNWGAHVEWVNAEAHDSSMGWIQVMRHLSTFVYGAHMAEEQADIAQLLQLSSPIYRMELMMVGRLFAQNAELYADIIQSHPEQFSIIKRYLARFQSTLEILERGDKANFVETFQHVNRYFGEFAEQFLQESEALVQLSDDQRFRGTTTG